MKLNRYVIGALFLALVACNLPSGSNNTSLSTQDQNTVNPDSNNCNSNNTAQDLLTMKIGELIYYKEQREDEVESNTGTLQKNSAIIKGSAQRCKKALFLRVS